MPRQRKPKPPFELDALMPPPHAGQAAVLASPARYRVVVCGRRWGKTELGKRIAAQALLDEARVWWLAPTYGIASQVWRDLKHTFAPLAGVVTLEHERRIDYGAGFLSIKSTHTPDNLRGAGLDWAILDECAFMSADVWAQIVRPMLLERRGRAVFISSPNGRNWFWELTQQARLAPEEWAVFHYPSAANPLVLPEELARIQAQTPERIWRAEYLAEFVADSGRVFRNLQACARAVPPPAPLPDAVYVAGVDWGREGDYTVIVVLDAVRGEMVALDRFHQVGWQVQRGRIAQMAQAWRVQHILAEANSIGAPNVEALQNEGLPVYPFTTSAQSKPPLIEALALAFEREELRILPDEVLLTELSLYTVTRTPSGLYQYSAPHGQHDDSVIALALAWRARGARPRLRFDFL